MVERRVLLVTFCVAAAMAQDGLAPVGWLEGQWAGESKGQPGAGRGERTYARALGARYLEGRNKVVYPPTDKSKGETHEDLSLFSFDKARGKIVLRQFHIEGFVNQYVCSPAGDAMVCESEAIENIPQGWRARLTWRQGGAGELLETFELAPPAKEFAAYTSSVWKKR